MAVERNRIAVLCFFGFLLNVILFLTRAAADPVTEEPLAHHVVIFSIDGCRPDCLLRANAPTVRDLMKRGSFTFWARTTDIAITLPSHTSMMTGVPPEVHGILVNEEKPGQSIPYPAVPTLFEIAKAHGYTTALFSTKRKFDTLARPGSVDWSFIAREATSPDDLGIASKAADAIRQHKPGVTMVHLGNCDIVGHAIGWGSPAQIAAIEQADTAVSKVIQAIHDANMDDDTLIILTSDHGGAGLQHGANDMRSRYIPWIAVGPNVRQNFDITLSRDVYPRTEDTFATACYFLALPIPSNVVGHPILQILHNRELLTPVSASH
jgi:predicted AlkP superfamily pyrophosphatase or phosphodiesterase